MIITFKYYLSTMFEKGYLKFAIFFTIFRELFAKYIFNDWDFVGFLFVLIVLDTLAAIVGVWRNQGVRSLSFKQAENFLIKVFIYFGTLVLSHILGNFTIHGEASHHLTWISTFLYFYMIVKEGFSVAKNINRITPGQIPEFLIQRLDRFIKTGKFSELLKDPEEPKL